MRQRGGPQQPDDEHTAAWQAAGALYERVTAGIGLEKAPPSLFLTAGESQYADVVLEYARYYAMTVTYPVQRTVVFGSLPLLAAGLLADAAANGSARQRAAALATANWREIHLTRAVLTNQRMLVLAQGTWLEFWHGTMLEMWPEPERWTWWARYNGIEPLRLRGPWAPWFCVLVGAVVCGPDWLARHPAFAPLRPRPTTLLNVSTPPLADQAKPELPPG